MGSAVTPRAPADAPLLLLHGFLGSPEVFAPLGLDSSRVFAPVLLGHTGAERWPGRSTASRECQADPVLQPPDPIVGDWGLAHGGFDSEVDRLAAWARERGFERGALCGYSLGARLALGLLHRHAELFTHALLISVHPGLQNAEERRQRLTADLEHCRILLEHGTATFVERWESLSLFGTQATLPAATLEAQRRTRLSHSAEGLVQSLLHCGLASMPSRGSAVAEGVALEVLAGERDEKFAQLARGIDWSNTRVEIVPGAGHNLLLERPDVVRDLLRCAP